MSPEDRIKELGLKLQGIPKPIGSYIPCVQTGNLLFLSGILPIVNGQLIRQGCVGQDINIENAKECVKIATINALSILRFHIGSLNKVKKCIRLTGYIASASNFFEQPKVLNAASDLLYEIFGEIGRHARSAVGVNILPLNSPVELEFIFEI